MKPSSSQEYPIATATLLACFSGKDVSDTSEANVSVCFGVRPERGDTPKYFIKVHATNVAVQVPNPSQVTQLVSALVTIDEEIALSKEDVTLLVDWLQGAIKPPKE